MATHGNYYVYFHLPFNRLVLFYCVPRHQSELTISSRSVWCSIKTIPTRSIEGRKDEELPEVLLGGCRVMEFDLNKVGSAPGSEKEELLENGIAATDSWS